jgi:hypothetical protein
MNEIFKIIFGDYTFIQLFGYMWFFIIGYVIHALPDVIGRDKSGINTPAKWNFKFWFKDNWRRYLVTFLCSYVFFRFSIEVSGHSFSNFNSLTLGILGDGTGALLKSKVKLFSADRKKLMIEYHADQLKKAQKQITNNLKSEQKVITNEIKVDNKEE